MTEAKDDERVFEMRLVVTTSKGDVDNCYVMAQDVDDIVSSVLDESLVGHRGEPAVCVRDARVDSVYLRPLGSSGPRSIAEYMQCMRELGYETPSLRLWMDERGVLHGSASFKGSCGHGGESGRNYSCWEDLIEDLFRHVTLAKPFSSP